MFLRRSKSATPEVTTVVSASALKGTTIMTFTTKNLTGNRVLVKGTDVAGSDGTVVLDGSQWADLVARSEHDEALAEFDSAVEAFFAPINEAAEALEQTHFKVVDPNSVVVLDEGEEGTPARRQQVVELTTDSQILRIIEGGNTDRLLWVGDSLEILEYEA